MSNLDEKIKEAARDYCIRHNLITEALPYITAAYTEGANFMRELIQWEVDLWKNKFDRHDDVMDARTVLIKSLRAKLDLANSALQSIETDIQYIGNEIKIRETAKYALRVLGDKR